MSNILDRHKTGYAEYSYVLAFFNPFLKKSSHTLT